MSVSRNDDRNPDRQPYPICEQQEEHQGIDVRTVAMDATSRQFTIQANQCRRNDRQHLAQLKPSVLPSFASICFSPHRAEKCI
jgi:hypothetical protein